jgi:ATPase subunit of ABC transporter with duplicated ATPase domains
MSLDLILLDEPTNHLDVEGVAWLATAFRIHRRGLAVVVVTHDRWFWMQLQKERGKLLKAVLKSMTVATAHLFYLRLKDLAKHR